MIALDVASVPRSELPIILGELTRLEAEVRLRLAEPVAAPQARESLLDAEGASKLAGVTKRWLLTKTRGMRFRRDLSRKQARFDEAGLRSWLKEKKCSR